METENRVLKTFAAVFQKQDGEIKITDTKESIDKWDSISHLHLIMSLEDEFVIRLNTEDVVEIDSVKKCIEIIEKLTHDFN